MIPGVRSYIPTFPEPRGESPSAGKCRNVRPDPSGGGDMLPSHGRYGYSSITSRADYSWPDGRRLAVYVALNIEAFGFGVGKGAAIAPPDQAQSHSIYSWRDYGNRVGIWRLFELLDELGLPAEAQLNTAIYEL